MSDSITLPGLAPLLGGTFIAGVLTQLVRQLARSTPPQVRVVIALAVAGGIAALTVTALMTGVMRPVPSPALLLAAACMSGWSGPRILTQLGTLLERKLGLATEAREVGSGNEMHRTHPSQPEGHTEA
ncbi:MAG: hypothetical protein AB1511_09075 [Deinococcota bacterium]